jgi:protein O-mannosyl-transferase
VLTDPATPTRSDRRGSLVAFMILTLAAVGPYLNAGSTIRFLDSLMLENIPEASNTRIALHKLFQTAFIPGQELSTLTIALNHQLNTTLGYDGFHAPCFVVVNIALHVINVWLLFALLRKLLQVVRPNQPGTPPIPLVLTILYAVHPIHVTTILDIVQRRGLLSGLFQTAGLLVYLRCRESRTIGHRLVWAAATAFMFWLCLKSRATGLAMPLVILSLEFVLHLTGPLGFRRFLKWGGAVLAVCVLAMFAFVWKTGHFDPWTLTFKSSPTLNVAADWSGGLQALSQASAYCKYAALITWPIPSSLCLDHAIEPTRDVRDWNAWWPAAIHIAILGAAVYAARRGCKFAAFGILCLYASQVPWLVLLHPGQVVEYRLYSAVAGPILILLEIVSRITHSLHRRIAIAMVALVISILASFTWQRNLIFRSAVQIWQDVVTKYPGRFRSEYNLANALFRESRYEEAVTHYRAACRADSIDDRPHYNLANTFLRLGRINEAAGEYMETIRRKPDHVGARQGLLECDARR